MAAANEHGCGHYTICRANVVELIGEMWQPFALIVFSIHGEYGWSDEPSAGLEF